MLFVACLVGCGLSEAPAQGETDFSFFESRIRPVLVEHCYECHSAEAGEQEGGLLLDTRAGIRKGGGSGQAIVPGDVKKSLLISAIQHADLAMPPDSKLPDKVVADFVTWIELGATDPRDGISKPPTQIAVEDHWAYQPPQRQKTPTVSDSSWPRDRIDVLVLARLDEAGLKPAVDADRRTLIRRATLELTGLIPTPEEIKEFLADPAPDRAAFTQVVDRLLASQSFGIRWGRHWLDVARYAESSGYTRNMALPLAWKYRNWAIRSFNNDKPYNEFVREQIAGDLLQEQAQTIEDRADRIIATGFLTIGPRTLNEANVLQFSLNTADEQIDTTCRAFLGLTASCARCHDHKFDPIPTQDYYALVGIFRSTKNYGVVETNVRREHRDFYPLGPDAWKRFEAYKAHEEKVSEQTAIYATLIKDRNAHRERIEKAGKEWQKVDDPELTAAEKLVQDQKLVIEQVRDDQPLPPEGAMAVADADEVVNSPVFDRGERDQPLKETLRGIPRLFSYSSPEISATDSGRRQLAEWVVDRRNPLTARVFVNRVWHHLFGIGLVESVDNLGALGAKPNNQQLLDDLAVRFMDDGWSVKTLIRNIVLSRTWMLSSEHDSMAYTIDPGNRLNWRFAPQPLEGEAIRDSILAVSGQLDRSIPQGSRISELSLSKTGQQREIGRRGFVVNDISDDVPLRTIFLPALRAHMLAVNSTFDAADPGSVVGSRKLTTLPKQAMFLMNSEFVLRSAERTAARIVSSDDPVDQARLLVLGRHPSDTERAAVEKFLAAANDERKALNKLCQTLMCSGEFRTVC